MKTADNHDRNRLRHWLRICGINFVVLLAGLIVIELIFGGWVFGENFGTLVIPKNFTRNYDVSKLYGGTISRYKRDKYGLRGIYDDPSKIDILTVGGSTTNEIFVSEGQTWSDVLARKFKQAGKNIRVVNAGVDGQSTIGHIKNFDLWFPKIPHLKARYVLAYIGINDLAVIITGATNKQDNMNAKRRKFKQFLLNNSVLYSLFRNIRGILRAKKANLIHSNKSNDSEQWVKAIKRPDVKKTAERMTLPLKKYAVRLRVFINRIREFGAIPVLVTQSWGNYRITDGSLWGTLKSDGTIDTGFYAKVTALNQATLKICKTEKITCFDLASELELGDGDRYDGLHTTPKGSEKIGNYLFEKLNPIIQQAPLKQ